MTWVRRYLNMAMEQFGNTETVPVYYVLFTLSTIVGSNILYRDFEHAPSSALLAFAAGCALTFAGVKLLTSRRVRVGTARGRGGRCASASLLPYGISDAAPPCCRCSPMASLMALTPISRSRRRWRF